MQLSFLLAVFLLAELENDTRRNAAYKPGEFMIRLGAGKKCFACALPTLWYHKAEDRHQNIKTDLTILCIYQRLTQVWRGKYIHSCFQKYLQ